MPSYAVEKFEAGVSEKVVYWVQTKHVHNAALITDIEKLLGAKYGGTWSVRANSFQSNQPKPIGEKAVFLEDIK